MDVFGSKFVNNHPAVPCIMHIRTALIAQLRIIANLESDHIVITGNSYTTHLVFNHFLFAFFVARISFWVRTYENSSLENPLILIMLIRTGRL